MALRVAIADDEMLLVMRLRQLMDSLAYEVVGTASTGKQAVDLCRAKRPDVVLMDVKMPEMSGLEATRELVDTCPTCVVMVTGNPHFEQVAAEAGAMGYVVKPAEESIASVVESARERFKCFLEIRDQAADIEEALKTWGLAWSAVNAVMREQGMSEANAWDDLKHMAAVKGVSIRAAAESVLGTVSDEARPL